MVIDGLSIKNIQSYCKRYIYEKSGIQGRILVSKKFKFKK